MAYFCCYFCFQVVILVVSLLVVNFNIVNIIIIINCLDTSLSVEPLNKVVNSKVKLKCVAVGCTFLDIILSSLGNSTNLPKDEENDPCDKDGCIVVSSTLKLTKEYSGSKVWCRAHNGYGSNVVESPKSLILLQGINYYYYYYYYNC